MGVSKRILTLRSPAKGVSQDITTSKKLGWGQMRMADKGDIRAQEEQGLWWRLQYEQRYGSDVSYVLRCAVHQSNQDLCPSLPVSSLLVNRIMRRK